MTRVLVAYATMAGSTADVAQVVAEELTAAGLEVDVQPIDLVEGLDRYDGVVVGGPMILGWHRAARRFLKQHRPAFEHMPLAVFVLAMSLTETGEQSVGGVPVYVDEELPQAPERAGRLTFRERFARLSSYLRPILRSAEPHKPASIGVFGGRMEYGRLSWWAVLFAMLIVRAAPGDRRNWPAIRAWAAGLVEVFQS
ncbi:MAG: flavodoxin domain-containing protein [Candidatus Promineifilaceae bacterium]